MHYLRYQIQRYFIPFLENSKLQCDQDNAEQTQSISALKEHLNLIISDVSEFKDENQDSIELIERSVTNVRNQVEDFTHSQKTLTSFVNNFKQDVEISIAGYLTHFTKYIGKYYIGIFLIELHLEL